LEGMNPIWRYLVISEFRERLKSIIGDTRLANFKLNPDKSLIKKEKDWVFIKKKGKTDSNVHPRIPVNFKPRKWIITPQQVN
jgi:hypothetical protein